MKYTLLAGMILAGLSMVAFMRDWQDASGLLAFLGFLAIASSAIHWLVSDPKVLAKRD